MKKYVFLLYIVIISLVLMVGCGKAKLEISGPNVVAVGSSITLVAKTNSNEPVIWRSSNKEIATVSKGVVSGIKTGEVTIYANCGKESASMLVKVVGETEESKQDDPFLNSAKEILNKMSLEQKVGELFIFSVDKEFSSSQKRLVRSLCLGNAIINPNKNSTYQELLDLVNGVQEAILSGNKLPGFIICDKDEATYKLLNSLATIPSSITILATDNEENAYAAANGLGNELRNFGFNAITNPNMLLNDEDEASYLSDSSTVSKYALKEMDGYNYAGVMAIGYSFPGWGEERWNGIPINGHSLDAMEKDDLLPFIDGFEKGLDAVVASNVIFSTFDNTYPATLSYPICTMLLRETLGYDGLLISNYLDSSVMEEEYRDGDNLAVVAINAGVDMLMYSDTKYLQEDYNAVLNAINSGEISLDRIDEAVIRIILKKNKYDLLDDNHYLPAWNALEYSPENEISVAKKIASECISLLAGDMITIEKDEKVLIASPVANSDLGIKVSDDEENSFAFFLYNKMVEAGYTDVSWQTFDDSDSWEIREIGNMSYDYDKVIFAIGSLDWRRRVSFNNNGIVVTLSVPLDISRIYGYISYVAAYGYELENIEAFANYLINGAKINDYRENIEE